MPFKVQDLMINALPAANYGKKCGQHSHPPCGQKSEPPCPPPSICSKGGYTAEPDRSDLDRLRVALRGALAAQ